MTVRPARLEVSPGEVEDLRHRVQRTRWPRPWPRGAANVMPDDGPVLRRLADHWATGYD
jgi:hypothetical protein